MAKGIIIVIKILTKLMIANAVPTTINSKANAGFAGSYFIAKLLRSNKVKFVGISLYVYVDLCFSIFLDCLLNSSFCPCYCVLAFM